MSKPKCVNHNIELEIDNLASGKGICPVSKCMFTFEARVEEEKVDKFGRKITQYKVVGEEN